MTGYCYIDGIDIYAEYGVFIEGDGYNELLSFPALKEPDKNDWPEEHGIEIDLSEPRLQSREVTISFAFIRGWSWRPFYHFIAQPGMRLVNIPGLGRSWLLRVSEMPRLENYSGADLFSVKFVEDNPAIPSGYPVPNADIGLACAVSLDGKTLDKYGIIIASGLDDFERSPKMKRSLTRSFTLQNGQLYDDGHVRYAEKEVTLGCCLNAARMADFWNLHDALFGDLLKPGSRKIAYKGKEYDAFYRKTGNWRLHSHLGEVVCEFDLTLCFAAFVINDEIYLLSSETGAFIATETGALIDLSY